MSPFEFQPTVMVTQTQAKVEFYSFMKVCLQSFVKVFDRHLLDSSPIYNM